MSEKFWQIKNEVNDAGEILLYGPIANQRSWFGNETAPKEFAKDLEKLGGRDVIVRINSGGGDVFAAHAIHNQLVAYKGKVTVVIDGLAASAATIIAMAGDKIIMPSNSMMMIHNPAICMDDYYGADELKKCAEALIQIKGSIVAAYKKRCKVSAENLAAMMDAETWMGAEKCVEKGFADAVEGSINAALNGNLLIINNASYDLSAYKNAGSIKNCINRKESQMNSEKIKEILNALGLTFIDEPKATDTSANNQATAGVTASEPVASQQQAVADAVAAERQRVADLEALDDGQNTAVTAIINAAKKEGKAVDEVKPYIDAVKTAPVQNASIATVADMVKDNKDSGVDGIGADAIDQSETEKVANAKAMDAMAQIMNKKFGGAK